MNFIRHLASAIACVVVCGGVGVVAQAQDSADDAAILQPFLSEATFLVLKVDPKRIALPDLAVQLESQPLEIQQAYRDWAAKAEPEFDRLRAATGERSLYATAGIPHTPESWPLFFLLKSSDDEKLAALFERLAGAPPSSVVRGDWTVISPLPGSDVARLLELSSPSPRPELNDAFAAVGDYPIQLALLPPEYLRSTMRDVLPTLPQQLGGGPSELLTEGLTWAALGIDPARLRVELVVQSASERAAGKLAAYLPTMLKSLFLALPDVQKRIPPETVEKLLDLVKPQAFGSRVALRLDGVEQIEASVKLLSSVAERLVDDIRQQSESYRFKQIVIAMHNHADVYGTFPPEKKFRDASGASKLSWRVHLLPYMERLPLYNEFHLDEAWDSPHNKPLIEKMPDNFKSGAQGDMAKAIKPGYTTVLAPAGNGAVFGGPKPTKLQDISDGTSNTIVLVEVKPELAVPWTAPDDYAFDPEDPGKGLYVGSDGRFAAAFADGSVVSLRADLAATMLRRLFQMNDGEPVDREAVSR